MKQNLKWSAEITVWKCWILKCNIQISQQQHSFLRNIPEWILSPYGATRLHWVNVQQWAILASILMLMESSANGRTRRVFTDVVWPPSRLHELTPWGGGTSYDISALMIGVYGIWKPWQGRDGNNYLITTEHYTYIRIYQQTYQK